jgi:fatty acid/phospholipid biosynthesis enzyme
MQLRICRAVVSLVQYAILANTDETHVKKYEQPRVALCKNVVPGAKGGP